MKPESGFSFARFADALRQIETTTSRREMTARLADLFRSDRADAFFLPYLLQGRLGPPYAAPNVGLDEQRLTLAIARAARTNPEAVWQRYRSLGDLGTVAEELVPASAEPVSVRAVLDELRRIADLAGPGASEAKVGAFATLLSQVGRAGARAVVRIAAGTLRLGVGDATIADALSVACVGDASLRPRIERAYSLCSDLGLVAAKLLSDGPAALEEIHPAPGRPVLPALAERLPSSVEVIRRLAPLVAEPKYDGLRLQAQKDGERVWLFTRRLEDVTGAFPEVVRGVCEQVQARQAILDGEAVGFDPRSGRLLPFQSTVRRRRKHGVAEMETTYPIRYYAFDLLFLDGADLTPAPERERSRRLRAALRERPNGPLFVTPQLETDSPAALDRFVQAMLAEGLEGAVVKSLDAPYHAGSRQYTWVKLKREYAQQLADTFDLVIVGYDVGKGRRARLGIGSLLGAVYDPASDSFRTVSRVGSGLSDAEWIELRRALDAIRLPERPARVDSLIAPDVWVEPRYVIEVIAGGITRSPLHTCGKVNGAPGYALRFPRVTRLRFDRRPDDATTQREVVEMYRLQGQSG